MRAGLSITVLFAALSAAEAQAQPAPPGAVARTSTRRTLAEYLFLGAQLGVRQRSLVYTEAGAPGPGGASELRFYLNGRASSGPEGPLGAYLGLGVIGRGRGGLSVDQGDPLRDPYDDFSLGQNLRLLSAHLEYQHRSDDGPVDLQVRAGRLSNLDGRAMLLLFDGAFAHYQASEVVGVSAFGGRRAALDRGFADQREDLSAQLVGGAAVQLALGDVAVELLHQFEDLQQTRLSAALALGESVDLGLQAQALYGGPKLTDGSAPFAVVLRLDGDFGTSDGSTTGYLVLEAQLGADPRVYGRGGRAATLEELQAARGVPIAAARLDRLFFGPDPGHGHAELSVTHWLGSVVGLTAGAFGRTPWTAADRSSLRPTVLELWLGPELALGLGHRLGAEVRLAFEDPGEPGRIFAASGDGQRQQRSARAWAELPFPLTDALVLAVRPEGEIYAWSSEGPTSRLRDQVGFWAGGLFTLGWGGAFRVTGRYGASRLPESIAEGVAWVHDAEVILEGAY